VAAHGAGLWQFVSTLQRHSEEEEEAYGRLTPCRPPQAAGLVHVHLVVSGRALGIDVLVLVLRVVVAVAHVLRLSSARREEVLDGAGQEVAALCRHVLEDLPGRRLALVDSGDFVRSERQSAPHAIYVLLSLWYGTYTYARFR